MNELKRLVDNLEILFGGYAICVLLLFGNYWSKTQSSIEIEELALIFSSADMSNILLTGLVLWLSLLAFIIMSIGFIYALLCAGCLIEDYIRKKRITPYT